MYTIYIHIHLCAIKCTCRFISRLIMDTTKDSKYYLKHSKLHGYKQAGIGKIPGIELEAPLFQIFVKTWILSSSGKNSSDFSHNFMRTYTI